jgi:hypothetical protein
VSNDLQIVHIYHDSEPAGYNLINIQNTSRASSFQDVRVKSGPHQPFWYFSSAQCLLQKLQLSSRILLKVRPTIRLKMPTRQYVQLLRLPCSGERLDRQVSRRQDIIIRHRHQQRCGRNPMNIRRRVVFAERLHTARQSQPHIHQIPRDEEHKYLLTVTSFFHGDFFAHVEKNS